MLQIERLVEAVRLEVAFIVLFVLLQVVGGASTLAEPAPPATCVPCPTDKSIVSPPTYRIGDPIPCRRIAVMELKVEGPYCEQVRDWLPALIEDRLLREGWTLVVRGWRMQHIQEDRSLPGVKPETRLPQEELLGATAFVELTARVQTKDIKSIAGFKVFGVSNIVRASVDLNGQVVDPATGVLKSSISVGGSSTGLKTALLVTIGSNWRIGAAGYDLDGIRESLVGKAADTAAAKLIERLKVLYPGMPEQARQLQPVSKQPSSTTIGIAAEPTILLDLPETASNRVGDRYGVYRGDKLIAQVEILSLAGKRAVARIVSQTDAIRPTDIARKTQVTISAQ